MSKINPQRLLDDLHTLRGFGRQGGGVVRPAFSPIDIEARRWLCERMSEAGLDASMDGVGNVVGCSPNPGPALLVGSHSDTQHRGGWLDGALGVIYALEVVRALREDPMTGDCAVDAVSWMDEESAFLSCLGSRAFCGLLPPSEIDSAFDNKGQSLREALATSGLSGEVKQGDWTRYRGYLEAHIEQGPYLEEAREKVGVVTAIVGSRNFTVSFKGQQNHAGTTPMGRRRDAGKALFEFASRLNREYANMAGTDTVWTFGQVQFDPGSASIIPGYAELHVQFRDHDQTILNAFETLLRELSNEMTEASSVPVNIKPVGPPKDPMPMDAELQQHLVRAAETVVPNQWRRMPSAAIHDAMYLARVMPAAMLFVPSIGGISHDFAEDTAESDIVTGCQVLATAAAIILTDLGTSI